MDDHSSEEEKKKTLNNFRVPSNPRWGNRRPLRAAMVSRDDIPSSTLHGRHFPTDSDPPANQPISDVRPPAVRRIPCRIKLKIKNINYKRSEDHSESRDQFIIPDKKEEEKQEKEPERVNNWRPRRACATESYKGGTLCLSHLLLSGGRTTFSSRPRPESADTISGGGGSSSSSSHKQTVGLEISLTNDEIEKDFLLMTGKKPPKRPKRRPRHVHQHLKVQFN